MIKILVDSGSDLNIEEAKKLDLILVSMQITLDNDVYLAGVDLDNKVFYEKIKTLKNFPKTSLLSPQTYLNYYEEAKKNNDDLIVITLSSGLSGTYQSALIAKDMVEYDRIYIIDSLSATVGERLLIDEALKLRSKGLDAIAIVNEIENLKYKTKAFAYVDTLEYLHKGGRLTKKQALIGEVINIKPIITFDEFGKLTVQVKTIGKKRGFKGLINQIEKYEIDRNYPLYFVYSVDSENALELKKAICTDNFYDFRIMEIGPTIGAHVGPNLFGLIFVIKK